MFEDISYFSDAELIADVEESRKVPYYQGKSEWDNAVRQEFANRGIDYPELPWF